jgi:trans-2,3-dihydro-3-hydroxyanthranilate isomerase
MRRRFVTLDVFTRRRFAGNPLAVVLDAQDLDTAAMQAIAREFNLSETVFVLPPAASVHRARLRIFTPGRELPFAGHPTVGTAVLLGRIDGKSTQQNVVLEEGVGAVHCTVDACDSERGFASFALPRLPEQGGPAPATGAIAEALNLSAGDIGFDNYAPAKWSAGNTFVFVPVRSRAVVERSRPDLNRWDAAFGGDNPTGAFVFCGEPVEANNALHARMFAPGVGIFEDPATGSAVAALAGLVARDGGLGDGEHVLGIEQGYAMGRPSLITLSLRLESGALTTATIGGDAIVVGEGTIEA